MERIGVLINKLQELHQEKASPDQLMHVLQMLQTEVFLLKQQAGAGNRRKIAVVMPSNIATKTIDEEIAMPEDFVKVKVEEVKIQEQPDNSLFVENKKEVQPVTQNSFNVFEEVPTLSHQPKVKELNEVIGKESTSLNDKLFEQKREIGEKFNDEPLKDLKKAIGVNDRYIFITELFRGDEAMYERSLKTINHFTIYPEAEFWIQRELKLKLGWLEDHVLVKQFDQLVRRRFL
ncbi:hypothetical protein DC498_03625 [Terrimonas sp.]|uniref:hypothetical protein n=1 Tax=Terrimonas sp. TaxID=1914338 RepID=UPI00092CBDBC|nr:hypothetical protein [Terrimonas sp.]OJY82391.1 MAG: hypothetical protein BGP13_22215 [Sphingobacteriales bacterium 40-81]PVD53616.1 hypothetical protein DC498_03625 [Terrimonas sp.]